MNHLQLIEIINKIDNFENLNKFIKEFTNEQLLNLKTKLDDFYYNKSESLISNEKYDIIKDIIINRNIKNNVGILNKKHPKSKLHYWMGSVSTFTYQKKDISKQINNWKNKNNSTFDCVTGKLDGVSALFCFNNNNITLQTRGNGEFGSNITRLAKYINFIPKNLKENICVRGELIISKENFNKNFKHKFKNPRNFVSGLINSKKNSKNLKYIDFIVYELINKKIEKQCKQLKILNNMGFKIVNFEKVSRKNLNKDFLLKKYTEFRDKSKYILDGIVIQSNKKYIRINDKDKAFAQYNFAFKSRRDDNIAKATVKKIVWNCSKWNKLFPVVYINPIELNGVTIKKISAHNAKYVKENKIGIDSELEITRSGDVIPYITRVIKTSKVELPQNSFWDKTKTHLICKEINSTEQKISQINNFFQMNKNL